MKPGQGLPHFRNATFTTVASPETKRGTPVVDNYYIRTLLDYDTFESKVGSIGKAELAKAKWVLDHFVVLLLDEGPDMVELMECYMDWKADSDDVARAVKHVNKTPGSHASFIEKQMDPDWVEELKRLNRFDMELYDYARQLAQKQLHICRSGALGQ